MTIRNDGPTNTAGRPNRRIRLWEIEGKPGSTIAKLQSVYLAALNSYDAFAAFKNEAAKSGKFTEQGVSDHTLNYAKAAPVPMLKRGRDAIAAAKREAAALRGSVKLASPDPAGDAVRREIRDRLYAMPPKDRDSFIQSRIDRLEPIEAEAILTAPAWLSGVSESHRTLLNDRALEAQHGEKVVELQSLEQAIEAAESAVDAARDEIRLELGYFDPHRFNQEVAAVERTTAAPWLKKDGDKVRVMTWNNATKTGAWEIATPEQQENGVYYENSDAYAAANPDWSRAA
jgi:hypothetical protein